METAKCNTLFSSSLFEVSDIYNRKPEGNDLTGKLKDYFINLPRKGYFTYYHPKNSYTVYNGIVHLQNKQTENKILKDSTDFIETSIKLKKPIIRELSGEGFSGECNRQRNNGLFQFPTDTIHGNNKIDYLHSLLYSGPVNSQLVDKLAMDEIIIYLLKVILDELDKPTNRSFLTKSKLDRHLNMVERGKEFILNNFRKDIELSDISSHAFGSPYHFSRTFKHFTLLSPYQYLIKVRLNHSVRLLLDTNDSVTQISLDAGFNTLSHFITTFSDRYNISPLQYRKKYR